MSSESLAQNELVGPQTTITIKGGKESASSYEGASSLSRELASWTPIVLPADAEIQYEKSRIDARALDRFRNDAYISGGVNIQMDSIVGGQYRLNAQPDHLALGLDEKWAEEFQTEVESKVSLYLESNDFWIDAGRKMTFTDLIRLLVCIKAVSGEYIYVAQWDEDKPRPFGTMIQVMENDRLCNPDGLMDSVNLRSGVKVNKYGAPLGYWFRKAHRFSPYYDAQDQEWEFVPTYTPWGRRRVFHTFDANRADQSRGISQLASSLKQMKMLSKFQDSVLQNAVFQAMYAATIESELPADVVYQMIGSGQGGGEAGEAALAYMNMIAAYTKNAPGMRIDGVKIPHLFTGTKLKMQPVGTPGGLGSSFEQSLLRHIAASLNLSYEQLSRDYTNTNYSSSRASMNEMQKSMRSEKRKTADRAANGIYALVLEEMIAKGEITSLPRNAPSFWVGLNREAYCRASWIGASLGQIDERKETEAAVMRIENNLSTVEIEAARLGSDFRVIYAQRAREKKLEKSLGIEPVKNQQKVGSSSDRKPASDDDANNQTKEK